MTCSLQDAKRRLPELIRRAQTEGPQPVAVRGQRVAIVLSAADDDAMRPGRPSLVDALLSSPAWDDELARDIDRRTKADGKAP